MKSSHQDKTFSFLPKFHIFEDFDLKKRVFRLIIFCMPKNDFFRFLFCFFEIFTSRRNFFVFTKISCLQRFWFKKNAIFGKRADKMTFFVVFFKSSHQDETFSFLPKFHIFNGLDLRKNIFVRLIVFRRPKKWLFLDFSWFFEIVTSRQNFFVFTQIWYLHRFWF